jgi:hypothetical protein
MCYEDMISSEPQSNGNKSNGSYGGQLTPKELRNLAGTEVVDEGGEDEEWLDSDDEDDMTESQ